MRAGKIVLDFELRRFIYQQTSTYGRLGRTKHFSLGASQGHLSFDFRTWQFLKNYWLRLQLPEIYLLKQYKQHNVPRANSN